MWPKADLTVLFLRSCFGKTQCIRSDSWLAVSANLQEHKSSLQVVAGLSSSPPAPTQSLIHVWCLHSARSAPSLLLPLQPPHPPLHTRPLPPLPASLPTTALTLESCCQELEETSGVISPPLLPHGLNAEFKATQLDVLHLISRCPGMLGLEYTERMGQHGVKEWTDVWC